MLVAADRVCSFAEPSFGDKADGVVRRGVALGMKKLLSLPVAVLLVAATAIITPLKAQRWVPQNGYWEVVSSVAKPSEAIVKYYDLAGHLIGQERFSGMRLDLRKRRTCRWLNKRLQTALSGWASRK